MRWVFLFVLLFPISVIAKDAIRYVGEVNENVIRQNAPIILSMEELK